MLEEFRAAIAKQQRKQQGPAALRARLHQFEADLVAQRKFSGDENDALRATNQRMAQHIQALTLHIAAQAREIAQLQTERVRSCDTVVPLT